VWVNNAGVTLFGRLEETPLESYRRVIDTNLFGYVHGARAAIPYLREQGSGVLINNASQVAAFGQPYTSAYVMTKHAIRALCECLRQGLLDAPGIDVCTLLPGWTSVDGGWRQPARRGGGRACLRGAGGTRRAVAPHAAHTPLSPGSHVRLPPPSYVANFDSGNAMLRATARPALRSPRYV
jgi:NAD(P)-dependent dehydrogenase (short-subunit alcohol dehydrogenase family)